MSRISHLRPPSAAQVAGACSALAAAADAFAGFARSLERISKGMTA